MKIRIAILLFVTALMIGGSLWAATLTTAQDYKPTPGGPVWLCPQFGDGACGWIIDTPEPVTMPYDWFRLRICEWLGICPAVSHG